MPDAGKAAGSVRSPGEWGLREEQGGGPFTSRLTWEVPEGGTATWASRAARKRGVIELRDAAGNLLAAVRPDRSTAARLRRLNWVAAGAFTIGGLLFAIGALVAQVGSGDAVSAASVFLFGGVFFSTGGYASLLQAINAPRTVDERGTLLSQRWRWWSYEPMRIEWLATFILFAGTLAFGISLVDSFIKDLSSEQVNRLIWAPEMVGCVMFLISGHLAMVEVCHGRPRLHPRSLEWWIVAANQLGSILFFIAALAAFIRPATGSTVNVDLANWGTFGGAMCFAIGGVLQAFERPSAPAD